VLILDNDKTFTLSVAATVKQLDDKATLPTCGSKQSVLRFPETGTRIFDYTAVLNRPPQNVLEGLRVANGTGC